MKKIIALCLSLLFVLCLVSCEKTDENPDFSKFRIAHIAPKFSNNTILYEVNENKVTVYTGDAYYYGYDEKILKEDYLENPSVAMEFELTDEELSKLKSDIKEIYYDKEENRPFVADAKSTLIGVNNKTIRYFGWSENLAYTNMYDVFDKYFDSMSFFENE